MYIIPNLSLLFSSFPEPNSLSHETEHLLNDSNCGLVNVGTFF